MFYLFDKRVAARNDGCGIMQWIDDKTFEKGVSPEVFSAMIEETRQQTKEHYELTQRPIVRISYPEYAGYKGMVANFVGALILRILMDCLLGIVLSGLDE